MELAPLQRLPAIAWGLSLRPGPSAIPERVSKETTENMPPFIITVRKNPSSSIPSSISGTAAARITRSTVSTRPKILRMTVIPLQREPLTVIGSASLESASLKQERLRWPSCMAARTELPAAGAAPSSMQSGLQPRPSSGRSSAPMKAGPICAAAPSPTNAMMTASTGHLQPPISTTAIREKVQNRTTLPAATCSRTPIKRSQTKWLSMANSRHLLLVEQIKHLPTP